jgi:hypothetical protein
MNNRRHLKRHAKARANQRVGINLHKNLHDQIVKDIQSNRYKPLYKSTHNRTVFEYDDEYNMVYDNKRKCLVTFIPRQKDIIIPEGDLEEPSLIKFDQIKPESLFPIRRLLNGD